MKIFKSKVKSKTAKMKVVCRRWSVVGALFFLALCLCASVVNIQAQTTEFTYQGRLLDSSLPPTANYDFEFSLYDSLVAGTQLGTTQTKTSVAVSNGIFTVRLDFGNEFPGSARFIQIAVRPTGGGAYTLLAPRQPITNVPYAVKSISADVAAVADTATTANNAQNLGGVAATQYVQTTDPRMSDARPPTPGSPSYIQNTNSQQASSNFNVSGNGTAGGTLSGQNVNSTFQYNIGGQPFLNAVGSSSFFGVETGSANLGTNNTYAGYRAGNAANSNSQHNSFFGANAGRLNSFGTNNSFFGSRSGEMNSFGGFNAFFGNNSGAANTLGNRNVFVGVTAGRDNIDGSDNVFVGGAAGQINGSGGDNSFFGSVAGTGNTTGSNNSFFGRGSGNLNVSGTFNTAIGSGANVGAGDLTFATAIGAGSTVSANNTIALGRSGGQDTVVVPGTLNVTGAINGTVANALTANNVTGVVAVANGGTGSSTQNFVDLTTNQTVGGTKTFTNPIVGNGSQLTNINGANITNNTINASAIASDTFPNQQNLKLLGSLRWDLLGQRVPVGASPTGVAFDGANIWVANRDNNNVTKLRASDGAFQGTFAVGTNPYGVTFDGANIWVANSVSDNVTKLRASDGALQGTFAVGTAPFAVAFDGANIWVANASSGNVTKLRASDGAPQGTFPVGAGPFAVAFDGANIWVVNANSANVTKLRASDGANLGTFAVGSSPFGVAFDGANIWVANEGSNNVTKLRASDGANLGTFAVGLFPQRVAFDGTNIWVANFSGNVTKLRASDGALQGTFLAEAGSFGVAFDGANIWVTNFNSNNVTKLPVFP